MTPAFITKFQMLIFCFSKFLFACFRVVHRMRFKFFFIINTLVFSLLIQFVIAKLLPFRVEILLRTLAVPYIVEAGYMGCKTSLDNPNKKKVALLRMTPELGLSMTLDRHNLGCRRLSHLTKRGWTYRRPPVEVSLRIVHTVQYVG